MPRYTWAGQDKRLAKKQVTLVCVTEQYGCSAHIKVGRVLSDLTGTDLVVAHVSSPSAVGDVGTLDYLYSVARSNGAMMQVLYDDNPAKALIKLIKHQKVRNIITGIPENGDSTAVHLWSKFTHISFFTVDSAGSVGAVASPQRKAMSMPRAALSSC